ncbi:MAG: hypothetical protein WDZ38_01400 [Balneolaceae bacterium]
MTKQNPLIAFLFSALIAFGATLSAIHLHSVDYQNTKTEQLSVDKDFHCAVCGSIFKFNPDSEKHIIYQESPELVFITETYRSLDFYFSHSFDGRAPPRTITV